MSERFEISETNPNDQIGGGGCVCGPTKSVDCEGPYALFYATDHDNNASPHVVLSLKCAEAFVRRATERPETILSAGEKDPCAPLTEPDTL